MSKGLSGSVLIVIAVKSDNSHPRVLELGIWVVEVAVGPFATES